MIINNHKYIFYDKWYRTNSNTYIKYNDNDKSYDFLEIILSKSDNGLYRLWFNGPDFPIMASLYDRIYGSPRKQFNNIQQAMRQADRFLVIIEQLSVYL